MKWKWLFAVFGATVLTVLAFVQPVTASASRAVLKVENLETYKKYKETIGEIVRKILSDKELKEISRDFLASKKPAAERFSLKDKAAMGRLEEMLRLISQRYRREITTLVGICGELETEIQDVDRGFDKTIIIGAGVDVIPLAFCQGKTPIYKENEKMDTGGTKYVRGSDEMISASSSYERGSGDLRKSNEKGVEVGECKAANSIAIMRDLNGNTYIYIPGYGWLPGDLSILEIIWLILESLGLGALLLLIIASEVLSSYLDDGQIDWEEFLSILWTTGYAIIYFILFIIFSTASEATDGDRLPGDWPQ